MAYVKHDRTKSSAEARVGDKDTIYYTTDYHSIIMNGQVYGDKWTYIEENELINLIQTGQLEVGTSYCIRGFISTPNPLSGLSTAGHKIDLTVKSASANTLEKVAHASYNTDGTDSFYEDQNIPVYKWDIEVAVEGSELGIAIGMKTVTKDPTSLYVGNARSTATNGTDTLIVIYNNTDKISVSKDWGETFYTQTLPFFYTSIQGIVYGNGIFVIYDEFGNLSVSSDNGDNWTHVFISYNELFSAAGGYTSFSSGFKSACYGNDQFYIIGNQVGIKSADGLNWTSFNWQSYDPGWFCPSIAAGDGFVGITAYSYRIMWSFDDCQTWTNIIPADHYWTGICFGNHTFSLLAGNRQGWMIPNTDTLTEITGGTGTYRTGNSTPRDPDKLCWNNGTFYAFSGYRKEDISYAYSTDGSVWTSVSFPKECYPQGNGSQPASFGPNGEMFIVDSNTNSVWVNPTPTEPDTWRVLKPTGIDKYQMSLSIGNLSIIVPNENSSYYLSYGDTIYTPYKFPSNMASAGVIHTGEMFVTVLYNYATSKSFYGTSTNGITWSLVEFPYETPTACASIAQTENGIICAFSDGKFFLIEEEQIVPISYSGEVYSKSSIQYISKLQACVYAPIGIETSSIYKISIVGNSIVTSTLNLTQATVISNMTCAGSLLYVSGYKSGNSSTVYTDLINLETNEVQSLTVPGYIISSVVDGTRVIACTSTNKLIILEGTRVITIDGIEVTGIYSNDESLLCQIVGNDSLNVLDYTIQHSLQITKLTDEFSNSCVFDFKNLLKSDNGNLVYFFDKNGSDYSLTGNVERCTQQGKTSALIDSFLSLGGDLIECSIIGDVQGCQSFINGAKYTTISDIQHDCNFGGLSTTLTNSHSKWINSVDDTIVVSDLNLDTRYITSDNGITWDVDTTDRIVEDDITLLVLNTLSLRETYLEPFDEDIAEQLNEIIG